MSKIGFVLLGALVLAVTLFAVENVRAQTSTDTYVLSEWVWETGDGSGYWRAPDCTNSVIDLRTIPEMSNRGITSGYGLFSIDSSCSMPTDGIILGNSLDSVISKTDLRTLETLFKLPTDALSDNTITGFVWDVLTEYADPTGMNGVYPLLPNTDLEIKLGIGNEVVKVERFSEVKHGFVLPALQETYNRVKSDRESFVRGSHLKLAGYWKKIYGFDVRNPDQRKDGILDPETIIGDTFVEGSNVNLGSHTATGPNGGYTWLMDIGSCVVVGTDDNVQCSASPSRFRANQFLSGSNMVVEGDLIVDSTNHFYVLGRYDVSAQNDYRVFFDSSSYSIEKRVGGTVTTLANGTHTDSVPFKIGVELDGTSISALKDDVVIAFVTDTSIPAGQYTGIKSTSGVSRFDNFQAFDLGDATATPTSTPGPTPTVTPVELWSGGEPFDMDTFIFIAGLFVGLILVGYGERYRVGQYIMTGAVVLVAAAIPTGLAWLMILMGLVFIPLVYRGYRHIVVSNRQGRVE